MIPHIDGGPATRLDWIAKLMREAGVLVTDGLRVVALGKDYQWLACDRCGSGSARRLATNGGVVVCVVAEHCRARRREREIHDEAAQARSTK